jgi:hypothetical protein
MVRRDERDISGGVDLRAGFRLRLPIDADLPGENQGACPLARRGEPFVDDQLVQPYAQFLQP